MLLMFLGGGVVVVAGFSFDHADFGVALLAREGVALSAEPATAWSVATLAAGAAILFSSFIGFDSIAQAEGEAKNPGRNVPLAVLVAVGGVGGFYLLFTAAVYNAVPWWFIAERAQEADLTAPGLLGYLLSPRWTVAIVAGATIALVNDLPAMLLAVSRLMFAWADDGIFPEFMARLNRHSAPYTAIVASAGVASAGIMGSHLAGDFFLGVDILATSMLFNFLMMCLSVLWLPSRNPRLAAGASFRDRGRGPLVHRGCRRAAADHTARRACVEGPLQRHGRLVLPLHLAVDWNDGSRERRLRHPLAQAAKERRRPGESLCRASAGVTRRGRRGTEVFGAAVR